MRTFFSLVETATEFETCSLPPRIRKPERRPLEKVIPEKITHWSVSRCQHGSYWTEKYGPIYCESCCPGASLRMIGVAPSPLEWQHARGAGRDRVYANTNAFHGVCQCGSEFYTEVDNVRTCSDCGGPWKKVKNVSTETK